MSQNMLIPEDLMPSINAIVTEAEDRIEKLIGSPIYLYMKTGSFRSKEEAVRTTVCKLYGVTWEEIKSPVRSRHITDARFMYCWFLMRHVRKSTYAAIGRSLNRDHTSIIHAVAKVNDLLFVKDPTFTENAKFIKQQIFIDELKTNESGDTGAGAGTGSDNTIPAHEPGRSIADHPAHPAVQEAGG